MATVTGSKGIIRISAVVLQQVVMRRLRWSLVFTVVNCYEDRGEDAAERSLLSCLKWVAEHERHFGESIDIADMFQGLQVNIPRVRYSEGSIVRGFHMVRCVN